MARIAEGYVVVNTAAEGNPKALASDLEALGLEDPAVFGHMVSGHVPMPAIPALKNLASLQFARPAYAMTLVGNVTSQGDVRDARGHRSQGLWCQRHGCHGGHPVGQLRLPRGCGGGSRERRSAGPGSSYWRAEIGDCTGAIRTKGGA